MQKQMQEINVNYKMLATTARLCHSCVLH